MIADRLHFSEISSTSDYAKELIENYQRLVITAEFQTNGRGRNQKKWLGNFGSNLYCSYAINHSVVPAFCNPTYYQILACLATFNTLRYFSLGEQEYKIKYPNDVYAKNNRQEQGNSDYTEFKKISGILAEHTFVSGKLLYTIIGIGVNVLQEKFDESLKENVTSLSLLGVDVGVEDISIKLIEEIEDLLTKSEDYIFNTWVESINLKMKKVNVIGKDGEFLVNQILNDCRLELVSLLDGATQIIDNGDSIRYSLE